VSQLTGVSDHKIWRVQEIYINAAWFDEDFSKINTIGMDEASVTKGYDYITLFVDLNERKTCYITDGKDHQTVSDFVEIIRRQKR